MPDAGLIAFVGVDGAGKTTQARLLHRHLVQFKPDTRLIVDRTSYVNEYLNAVAGAAGFSGSLEMLGADVARAIMAADFCRYMHDVLPVGGSAAAVMDRSVYCQLAFSRSVGATDIERLRLVLSGLRRPTLTFFLDVSARTAFDRVLARGTDREDLAHLGRFADAYRQLPEFESFIRIDAERPVADVAATVIEEIKMRISSDSRC